MGFLVYCIMTGLLLDSLIESKKGPLKRTKRHNKPASMEQKQIDYKRENTPKFRQPPIQLIEGHKIHSIAWNAKTREIEEIKYQEV